MLNYIGELPPKIHERYWIENKGKFITFKHKFQNIPLQGWKIHLSCHAFEIKEAIENLFKIVENFNVSFKVSNSLDNIILLNSGEAGTTQIGKIITIYTDNNIQAANIASALDNVWNSSTSPTAPSDLTVREAGNISLRYGSFITKDLVSHSDGSTYPALYDKNGDMFPDKTSIDGKQSKLAAPFPKKLFASPYFGCELKKLKIIAAERYHVIYQLSNRDFVKSYFCLDKVNRQAVVVKVFSKRSASDLNGHDFKDRANNEMSIMTLLYDKKVIPYIFESHEDNYFLYLSIPYIKGDTFDKLSAQEQNNNILKLFEFVSVLHKFGIIHRDLSLKNIIVNSNSLYAIDFELASFINNPIPIIGGTENHVPPEGMSACVKNSYDSFSLGSCLIEIYTGAHPSIFPSDPNSRLKVIENFVPSNIFLLIERLYDRKPDLRPSACECIEFLSNNNYERNTRKSKSILINKTNFKTLNKKIVESGRNEILTMFPESKKNILWQSSHPAFQSNQVLGINTGISGVLLAINSDADLASCGHYNREIELISKFISSIYSSGNQHLGMFTGLAGGALALGVAYKFTKNKQYIYKALDIIRKSSENSCYDFFSGLAGALFVTTQLLQFKECKDELNEAACVIMRKITSGVKRSDNINVWPNINNESYNVGMAHGTIGIAFALTKYGMVTGSKEPINLGLECLQQVFKYARDSKKGFLHHSLGQVRPSTTNYTWCHGTAGFLWVLAQLHEHKALLSEEIKWSIQECSKTIQLNNPTCCHGLSGMLEVWRLVSSFEPSVNPIKDECLYGLIKMSQRVGDKFRFSSENSHLITSDFWVGSLGSFSSILSVNRGSSTSILDIFD